MCFNFFAETITGDTKFGAEAISIKVLLEQAHAAQREGIGKRYVSRMSGTTFTPCELAPDQVHSRSEKVGPVLARLNTE